ncbi:MAG: 4-hydroxy-tetrahydrodipicolinate synthase [Cyclobacteriaceae bacterium]
MNELRGTGVALVTPFDNDLKVDYAALEKIVAHTVSGGVDYLVVMGTTAESPTLSREERLKILTYIIGLKPGVPIIYGLGGNNTLALIDEINLISGLDISALLSVTPYYNRPSQKGMIQHFSYLADNSPWPIILYNVPFRTGINLEADSTVHLSEHGNIIGVKEASGDLQQCQQIATKVNQGFHLISGDDPNALAMIDLGGSGIISVIANYLPEEFASMIRTKLSGDDQKAKVMDAQLADLYKLMAREGNPVSVKTAMETIDLCNRRVRMPLYAGSEQLFDDIKSAHQHLLINQ